MNQAKQAPSSDVPWPEIKGEDGGGEFEYITVQGEQTLRLSNIKPFERFNTHKNQTEIKLMFAFEVLDVDLAENQRCTASVFCTPSLGISKKGTKSHLRVLLSKFNDMPDIPEDVRKMESSQIRAYLQTFKGKEFRAYIQPSDDKKWNNIILETIRPVKEEKRDGKTGFEGYADAKAGEAEALVYLYDLEQLPATKLKAAMDLLEAAGASQVGESTFQSPVEIPKLKNYFKGKVSPAVQSASAVDEEAL